MLPLEYLNLQKSYTSKKQYLEERTQEWNPETRWELIYDQSEEHSAAGGLVVKGCPINSEFENKFDRRFSELR